jgi:ribonuclease T1
VTRGQLRSALVAGLVALLLVGGWLLEGHGSSDDEAGTVDPNVTLRVEEVTPTADPESGLPYVAEADLPAEARTVLTAIDHGGPFDYPGKDGSTFGNYEGLLPPKGRDYYAEYTVPTPGERDRGARRIIAGDHGELYWTADHYASFAVVLRDYGR